MTRKLPFSHLLVLILRGLFPQLARRCRHRVVRTAHTRSGDFE